MGINDLLPGANLKNEKGKILKFFGLHQPSPHNFGGALLNVPMPELGLQGHS